MRSKSPQLILLCAVLTCSALATAQTIPKGEDRVQVFIGVTNINNQTGELQDGSGEPVEIDFDNLPTIGLEVETPFGNRDSGLEYGVNAGGGFSWKSDGTQIAGTAGGSGANIAFRVDNSFTLAELHLGGYLRAHFGTAMDFYLGAGPAIIYGGHDVDNDDDDVEIGPIASNGTVILVDGDSSDFSLGYYARAGVEFDLGRDAQWGFGVRYLGGQLDFDDTIGKFDVEAVQVLLTYSARL